MAGLYVHVPFCARRCHYCDFISFARRRTVIGRYLRALEMEALRYARAYPGLAFETVYIGGGTPSLLCPRQLRELFGILRGAFNLSPVREFTVEANPESFTPETAAAMKAGGATRLSFGFQSCQRKYLKLLGRRHTPPQARSALRSARSAGFENINIDLIFGIPFQTLAEWKRDLSAALALKPAHLSLYELTLKNDSPLARYKKKMDPDRASDMYEYAISALGKKGYERYEISNFSRPGRECAHNLGCWLYKEYVGLGCGAWSFFRGRRYRNSNDLETYIAAQMRDEFSPEECETPSELDRRKERLFLGLRLSKGIGYDASDRKLFRPRLERFERLKLITWERKRVCLTPKGLMLANQVLCEIV